MDETNAFSAINQLAMQQNISPSKAPQLSSELLNQLLLGLQNAPQLPPMSTLPPMPSTTTVSHQMPLHVVPTDASGELVASPSAGSDASSSQQDDDVPNESYKMPLGPLMVDGTPNVNGGLGSNSEQKSRSEQWVECFTTTSRPEYEALVYSVYVNPTTDKKPDGWLYHDCLHRLQSKCRYRLRTKQQDEFFICEERGCHNHGAVEPVGQAGSHAGLPKTIREIVDRSYNESWPVEIRAAKVEEEIKRLGLPANPRLGRQIDNRVAYLRRVKNLHESRKMSDQVAGEVKQSIPGLFDPNILQTLMEQNGGSLVMEKGAVEQLIGSQAAAALAAAQNEIEQPAQLAPQPVQPIPVSMPNGFGAPEEQENTMQ